MGRVHFVGGEKGGVGKSVLARLLIQYWIDRAVEFEAFDTDLSHGALVRHYAGYAQPLDVDRMEELDRIVDGIEEGAREVVVDLASRTERALETWLDAGEVLELLERMGHDVWYWYVIDGGKDSARLLASLVDRLPRSVTLVSVRNQGRASDFQLYEEAKLGTRIAARGGHEIELPDLHARSMHKIDAYDKSFWAAIHNVDESEGPCLSRMERQRAKVAIRRAHDAMRGLLEPGIACGAESAP
ncbi:MAG: mobilization protein [bacterium]|nr:mobilization protein [bacterium]